VVVTDGRHSVLAVVTVDGRRWSAVPEKMLRWWRTDIAVDDDVRDFSDGDRLPGIPFVVVLVVVVGGLFLTFVTDR